MAELLERGHSALCIVVGSDESIITAVNTLNTLKSLESISVRTKLPVVMYYEHNDRERKRSEVDGEMRLAISTLIVLANRRNREIDTRDVANWLQFSRTTSVEPQLSQLEIFTSSEEADRVSDPISISSIYATEDTRQISVVPEYHAAGYLSERSAEFEELHYVISIENMPNISKSIKGTLEQYYQQRDGRVKHASILGDDDDTTEDGLVL